MQFFLGYHASCLVRLVLAAAAVTAGPAATRTETAESSAGFAEKKTPVAFGSVTFLRPFMSVLVGWSVGWSVIIS